jgi:hypothetical protein
MTARRGCHATERRCIFFSTRAGLACGNRDIWYTTRVKIKEEDIYQALDIQMKRIGQMQVQIDELRKKLTPT